jgi:predicted RNA binding protein YcfA (HicA-like mRNA interferase family)
VIGKTILHRGNEDNEAGSLFSLLTLCKIILLGLRNVWKELFFTYPMKVREVVKLIEEDGWMMVRQKGSHRQFHHPCKSGTVTIAGNMGLDIPPGTLNSILKQSGLKGAI